MNQRHIIQKFGELPGIPLDCVYVMETEYHPPDIEKRMLAEKGKESM